MVNRWIISGLAMKIILKEGNSKFHSILNQINNGAERTYLQELSKVQKRSNSNEPEKQPLFVPDKFRYR